MQASARRLPTLRPGQPTAIMAYIHHRHLLLLSTKADTHCIGYSIDNNGLDDDDDDDDDIKQCIVVVGLVVVGLVVVGLVVVGLVVVGLVVVGLVVVGLVGYSSSYLTSCCIAIKTEYEGNYKLIHAYLSFVVNDN